MKIQSWLAPVLPLLLLLTTAGCTRKAKPVTTADLTPPEATSPSAPGEPPNEIPAERPVQVEDDPWSGDLDEVNAYAASQGLLGDVYFGFDEAALSLEARATLAATARLLRERAELLLALEGHCDERGTTEYNLALGDRRAQAAKSYLVSLGIAEPRLSAVSFGEESPVCREAEEPCWRQNRRAHSRIAGRSTP